MKSTTVTYTDLSGQSHTLQVNGASSSDLQNSFVFDSTATQNIFYPDSGTSVNSASYDSIKNVNIFTLNGNDTVTLTNSSGVVVNPGLGADIVSSTGGQGNTIVASGGDTITVGDKGDTVFLQDGNNTVTLNSNHSNTTLYVDPSASGNATVTGFKDGDIIQVGGTHMSSSDLAANTTYTTSPDGKTTTAVVSYTDDGGNSHTITLNGLDKGSTLSSSDFAVGDMQLQYNSQHPGSITHVNLASGQQGNYTDTRDFSINGSDGNETFNIKGGGNNYAYGNKGDDKFNVNSDGNVLSGGAGKNVYDIQSGDSNRVIVGESDTINLSSSSTHNIVALNSSSGSATVTGFNASGGDYILIDDGRVHSYQDFQNNGGTLTYDSAKNQTTVHYTDSNGTGHDAVVNGQLSSKNIAFGDSQPDQSVTTSQDTSSSSHHHKFADDMTTIGLGVLSAGLFSVGMASFNFYNQKKKFSNEINKSVQDFYGRNPNPNKEQLEGLVDSFSEKIKNFNEQGKNTFAIAGAITGFGGGATVLSVTGAVALIGLTGPIGIAAALVGAVAVAAVVGIMGYMAGSGISGNAADMIVKDALNSPENKKGPNQKRIEAERAEKEVNRNKYIGRQ